MTKKAYKRITKGEITFLSLCSAGKNLMPSLYKAAGASGQDVEVGCVLLKADAEQTERGELTGLVYVPGKVDADGEFAGEDVIKELAYSHGRNGFQLDLTHDNVPLTRDQAFVAESFIVQKGDPRFQDARDVHGEPVTADGGWAVVVKLLDPKLRELYKSGAWDGLSMGGRATREPVDAVTKSTESEDNMALSDEDLKKVAEIAAKAAAEAVTKAQPQKTEPKFDRTSLKAVRARREALEKARLEQEAEQNVDWDDPESIKAYEEELEKAESETKKARQAERASRAPVGERNEDPSFDSQNEDEVMKAYAGIGSRMADKVNKDRGYTK